MAEIRAFYGIRPCKGKAAGIAALPYDVYNRAEAAAEVRKHPDSFLQIDRPEIGFADSVDMYDERVYARAHDLLWKQIEDGIFLREQKKCYYLYELTMGAHVQTGLAACVSLDDYRNGIVLRHENTRAQKEADRTRHVDVCNAQTGPVFLAYRTDDTLRCLIQQAKNGEAEYDFVSEDGIRHRIFVISDETLIQQISRAFQRIDRIYIADGHHRAASAVKVGLQRRAQNPDFDGTEEYNSVLSVLFADEELQILPYHRVVKDLNGYSAEEFYTELTKRFEVTELTGQMTKEPPEKGCFSVYLQGRWFLCKIPAADRAAAASDPVRRLDVSFLQEMLLDPVLGITDPKTDSRIDFVGGIRGTKELERRCREDCAAAFAMYPTELTELFAVADAGRLMPPKSTWFEPKLRSGLLIHALDG